MSAYSEEIETALEAGSKLLRLHSAAPLLLSALRKCRTELLAAKDGSTGGIPNDIILSIPEAIGAADAAIISATGAP